MSIGRKKVPTLLGDGKWETFSSIKHYRRKRDKKNKSQKNARKRNRNG